MRQVVREEVVVDRSPSVAWKHLAKLEEWPSWAVHIRRMDPNPPGDLTDSTQVVLHMRAGPRTKMIVTEYDPPQRWVWEGRSFGVTTRFEHKLEEIGGGRTRIWFLDEWAAGRPRRMDLRENDASLPGAGIAEAQRRDRSRQLAKRARLIIQSRCLPLAASRGRPIEACPLLCRSIRGRSRDGRCTTRGPSSRALGPRAESACRAP